MNRVDGKVALVTGAGSGIGEATSELLAKAGAKVIVTDINLGAAENTAEKIIEAGGAAIAVKHDVASESDWLSVFDAVIEHFGELNILVNNAAVFLGGEIKDGTVDNWRRLLDANLLGGLIGVRGAVKLMSSNKTTGSIVNISSGYGLVGGGEAAYSASKGGMASLTKAIAVECGKQGYDIRINTIHPGAIDTPVSRPHKDELKNLAVQTEYSKMIPMGRFGLAVEVARGILFLASDDSSYITGSAIVIDGGYTAA